MADKELSHRLRDEIAAVEKLLEEAQNMFHRLRSDIDHLKDRLKTLKELANAVDRERDGEQR